MAWRHHCRPRARGLPTGSCSPGLTVVARGAPPLLVLSCICDGASGATRGSAAWVGRGCGGASSLGRAARPLLCCWSGACGPTKAATELAGAAWLLARSCSARPALWTREPREETMAVGRYWGWGGDGTCMSQMAQWTACTHGSADSWPCTRVKPGTHGTRGGFHGYQGRRHDTMDIMYPGIVKGQRSRVSYMIKETCRPG